MKMINVFNANVSEAINHNGDFYKVLVGDPDFTPGGTINDSEDVDCGALCNELEYARIQTQVIVKSFIVDNASEDELDMAANAIIDLPRRGTSESDANYRERFNAIVRQGTNQRRTTRWAISEALVELGLTTADFHLLEFFDAWDMYFQVRLIGAEVFAGDVLVFDDPTTGFFDQYYLGGIGVGSLQAYVHDIVTRIKALGVSFDILVVTTDALTKTSDAHIASISTHNFTKYSDAIISVPA